MLIASTSILPQLCAILGEDPNKVYGITLTAKVNDVLRVVVEKFPDMKDANDVAACLAALPLGSSECVQVGIAYSANGAWANYDRPSNQTN